jgi:DNA polymerase-3 subunit gamma/tau
MKKKYQVIARKYRPQSFRDVVGQDAAVTTLKNAIRFDKVAHAYLFCGSRGVGKTTLARLFAKALNCLQPTDLEPCNACPSCLEIASGQSLDVIEIDGASNRGIDDIRQINETVGYAPSHGKYKIYIIDEVHMLTKEAFNALLKTLEEPPEKAKFFFATTEPHKVLPTIISRCQRFDLARISSDRIASKLRQIALDLNRVVEDEALDLIASFSDGSLRDAESLLDQILCFAEGTIAASAVRQSLGLVSEELFFSLDQAFSESRLPYAFECVDHLFQSGKDLAHFFEQLIEHYRRIALVRTLGNSSSAEKYNASARLYTQAQALHILDLLIQAEPPFQKSAFQRISLESILLQIIRSKNRIPVEVLVKRLSQLEDALKNNTPEPLPPLSEANSQALSKPAPLSQPIKREESEKEIPQIQEKPDPKTPKPDESTVLPPTKQEVFPAQPASPPINQEELKNQQSRKAAPQIQEKTAPEPKPSAATPLPSEASVEILLKPIPFNPFKEPVKNSPPPEHPPVATVKHVEPAKIPPLQTSVKQPIKTDGQHAV